MMLFVFLLFSSTLHAGIRDYLAARAYDEQNYAKAAEAYTKLVASFPENAAYIYGLANALYQLQDYQQAAHYYTLLSQQMQGLPQEQQEEVYFNSGAAFAQQQKWKEALASFEAVLQINPQNERAKKNWDIIKKLLEQPPKQRQQQNQQDNEKQGNQQDNEKQEKKEQQKDGQKQQEKQSQDHTRHSRGGGNPNKRERDQENSSQRREQQDQTARDSESKQNSKKEKHEQERKKNRAQEQSSQADQDTKNERGGSTNDSTHGHEKQGDQQRLQQKHKTQSPSLKEATGKEEKTQAHHEWQDKLSWQQQQQLALVQKLDKEARVRMMRVGAAQTQQQGYKEKNEQTW